MDRDEGANRLVTTSEWHFYEPSNASVRKRRKRKGLSGRVRGSGKLAATEPRQLTGYLGERWRGSVRLLRPKRYRVSPIQVTGAAPKDFIFVYERAPGVSVLNPTTWPAHIAKVGHKWYPSESVTEQLMTRIGQILGFKMADSSLMRTTSPEQIRFLSRYFLEKGQSLVHGAEIVSGYLADDHFVSKVQEADLEREFFTFQVLQAAVETRFPAQAEEILKGLVRVIAFDALVGNQDRHLLNWGVIVHPKGEFEPYFSPIYDSARGLFWNVSDEQLVNQYGTPQGLHRYVIKSTPLIGWDGAETVNHFQLVSYIARSDSRWDRVLRQIQPTAKLRSIASVLESEFPELLSTQRRKTIVRCLKERFKLYREAVEQQGGII